ncbi:MAG: iron-sulfur cluster carrier protein ApbC [Endozoicomonadaceae bacterium]|nr:iron-sulfur cluster carrier protein ApbC [Endozoicomonadaceae bacterium]
MTEVINQSVIEQALRQYHDPYLGMDLVSAQCVRNIVINGVDVRVDLLMRYPCGRLSEGIARTLQDALEDLPGVMSATVTLAWHVEAMPAQANLPAMSGISNIIAVASGKGGVGKSTVTANLALALAAEGARVGVLDADIYGPSQGVMFGIAGGVRPEMMTEGEQQFFVPIESHGVQVMSMAFLVTDNTPMIWRGPMVSGALQQLLTQTHWEHLDYLMVDMPPGTGDIQLTLAQRVPVVGSLIVTTPQDLALLDARKGIEMFRKVDVPVLGVVENMATHTCTNCGHTEHLFGEGGGAILADEYDTELLVSLPLTVSIREQADSGCPTVIAEPDGEIAMIYRELARRMAAQLSVRNSEAPAPPTINISDD